MTKLITVRTATPAQIWPDGSNLSAQAEDEIIKIARTEISAEDVARSDLVFSQWYIPYHLAEGRWRDRQKQQAEQQKQKQVTENENAKRITMIERRLASTTKSVNLIFDTLLSKPKDDPKGELRLFHLIRNVAWDQLVDRKILRDCGVWDVERIYGPGAACTDRGALWIAQQENSGQRPGEGVCWRLSHKSDLSELRSMTRDIVRDELHKHWTKGTAK